MGGPCGGHRSLHTGNQVRRIPQCDQLTYLGTLRREPGESCIKLLGVRSIQRVQRLHWPSMASKTSKRLKGFKGFKDLQRSRQRSRRPVRERESSEDQQRTKIGEIERGVAEMQHLFAWCCTCATVWCNVILYSVSGRHSVTQHLVAKKTNNFNGLTQKNRLTAVRHH